MDSFGSHSAIVHQRTNGLWTYLACSRPGRTTCSPLASARSLAYSDRVRGRPHLMRCPGPVSYVRKCSLGAGLCMTRLRGDWLSEGGEGYEFCCIANDYRTNVCNLTFDLGASFRTCCLITARPRQESFNFQEIILRHVYSLSYTQLAGLMLPTSPHAVRINAYLVLRTLVHLQLLTWRLLKCSRAL